VKEIIPGSVMTKRKMTENLLVNEEFIRQ